MQITYPINNVSSGLLCNPGSPDLATVLVILVDGPCQRIPSRGHDLEAGMWLALGCLAAAAFTASPGFGTGYAPLKQDKHHREGMHQKKMLHLNQDKHPEDKHQRMHQK
jgi:hypothetical protein